MTKNIILTLGLLMYALLSLSAQTTDSVPMHHYGIADGLPNEQARRVVEMPDGRMLVLVDGMFALFDGERFRTLEYSRQDAVGVESFLNADYWTDGNGLLWMKDSHHLMALDPQTCRFASPAERLTGSGVGFPLKNFFIDAEGQAWLHAADNSLYRYDWSRKAQRIMTLTQQNNDGNPATVCDVVQVGRLHYIFLSNDELVCFDTQQNRICWTQPLGQPWGGFRLKGMAWDDHTLLIRTREQLIAFDVRLRTQRTILTDSNIFAFRRFGQDLWVSSRGHLYRLDGHFNLVEHIQTVVDDITGTPLDTNWQGMAIDRQGGLWVCTFSHGVMYRSPARRLARFHPSEGRDVYAQVFKPLFPEVQLPDGVAVTDMQRDRNGAVWVTTREQSIYCFSPDGHRTDYNSENVYGIWGTVSFIAPDDGLFACHLNRLGILHPQQCRMDNLSEMYPELLRFRNMIDCCAAKGGWLIGTQNGFFFFDAASRKPDFEHFSILNENPWSDKCNCLLRDSKGIIWIGTQNGLLRYDERAKELLRFGTADGLPNNCVQSLVEDKEHRLWVATIGGIARMSGTDVLLLGPDDGLRDHSFLERAASADAKGILRFGTSKGVYTIAPDEVTLPQLSLTPRLMALYVHDELWDGEDLSFSYDQNYLTFDVSALNYAWTHHTVYRYRLTGLDRQWTQVAGSAGKIQIHYTGLAPGHYTLEVEAAMQGQPWGSPLTLQLHISPPWWQSWWAWTLYVVLSLTLVWYIIHSYVQAQRHRLAIEQQEARIRQLLEQIRLRSQLPEDTKAEHQEEIRISAQDEAFLQKAMSLIEKHMDDSEYGVEAFSSDMAMERTTLYRRLQTVVGKSPTDFMRTVRLKRAAELLRTKQHTVGEVSDMTGFPNRKAFSKYFKEAFGVLPSQYLCN